MRLHHMTIGPRSVTVDGVPLIVSKDTEPEITMLAPGLTGVNVTVFCETVVFDGDNHQADEPTPIYDQVRQECDGTK